MDTEAVVITHGGCADGTAAAHMFALFDIGTVHTYYSYSRDFARNVNMPDLAGKRVYITDYSFPSEVLLQIARVASQLYLWDHHESAARDLGIPIREGEFRARLNFTVIRAGGYDYTHADAKNLGLEMLRPMRVVTGGMPTADNTCIVSIVLDSGLCGAEVTFRELARMYEPRTDAGPTIRVNSAGALVTTPWYLQHIRDRDLWLWDRPGMRPGVDYSESSRAFGEALFELGISEATFAALDTYKYPDIARMYERGTALQEHNARIVRSIVSKASRVIFEGVPAQVAQSQILQSEIGNMMVRTCDNEFKPQIGIIIRYNFADNCWNISMRGHIGSPNLSMIAKKYGGGGHPLAAGFDYSGDITKLWTRCE